jgi:hypothetical protein
MEYGWEKSAEIEIETLRFQKLLPEAEIRSTKPEIRTMLTVLGWQ